MKELAAADLPYRHEMWPREEAKQYFADRGEPLKVQLIDEKTAGQSEVSTYVIKDRDTFVDFCVGPHVPSSGKLKAFKLLTTSNAYWKGDARNQPMQRVYGTAFFTEKELQAYLTQIEEAKSVCRRCPVIEPCLQWALESGQDAGVWGGLSEDERRALKRRTARARARA